MKLCECPFIYDQQDQTNNLRSLNFPMADGRGQILNLEDFIEGKDDR